MTTHVIKIWPRFFDQVDNGVKPFEVRRNDRDYKGGDVLILQEWDPGTGEYTGRSFRGEVLKVWNLDDIGIPGFVAFTLRRQD